MSKSVRFMDKIVNIPIFSPKIKENREYQNFWAYFWRKT